MYFPDPLSSISALETWEDYAYVGFLVPMNLKVYDEFRKEDRNNLPIIDRNVHIAHPVFNRRWVHVIFIMGPLPLSRISISLEYRLGADDW
jgi:hypothetical protein